jgi:hypothetical protein
MIRTRVDQPCPHLSNTKTLNEKTSLDEGPGFIRAVNGLPDEGFSPEVRFSDPA